MGHFRKSGPGRTLSEEFGKAWSEVRENQFEGRVSKCCADI